MSAETVERWGTYGGTRFSPTRASVQARTRTACALLGAAARRLIFVMAGRKGACRGAFVLAVALVALRSAQAQVVWKYDMLAYGEAPRGRPGSSLGSRCASHAVPRAARGLPQTLGSCRLLSSLYALERLHRLRPLRAGPRGVPRSPPAQPLCCGFWEAPGPQRERFSRSGCRSRRCPPPRRLGVPQRRAAQPQRAVLRAGAGADAAEQQRVRHDGACAPLPIAPLCTF